MPQKGWERDSVVDILSVFVWICTQAHIHIHIHRVGVGQRKKKKEKGKEGRKIDAKYVSYSLI